MPSQSKRTDTPPLSSHAIAPEPAEAWLRVASIVRPQGHRGDVIADLLTDFPERFADRPAVALRPAGATVPTRHVTVTSYRMHQGRVVLHFDECATMNDAETLRGLEVVIPWEKRKPLPEDEVYIAELSGCVLIDTCSGRTVGTVIDVDRETSNSALLVVSPVLVGREEAEIEGANSAGEELLIPFVKAYKPRWDLKARTLHMELPDGLLDLTAELSAAPDEPRDASSD
ncbi:ribosome maturation factor RimM [Acidipila sp. EB88]|uniref:ribosome maturation factor RimM n=1 Tax=Acidipila sp. EB88 TaxID=2305226 RepID=UPI000F5F5EB5|nr:ribosome maturation factor RimM [Acidipila sp. EB88]RRA47385.1 16S rRNA processing protein RimM [Acidipila sp. EB88]